MAKSILIAFALIFAIFSCAKAEPSCIKPFDSVLCRVPLAAPEASIINTWKGADLLCCCKTHSGGECCTRIAECGGKPPGCFCASLSVPSTAHNYVSKHRRVPVNLTRSTCRNRQILARVRVDKPRAAPKMTFIRTRIAFVVLVSLTTASHAQSPGKVELEVASTLIGSPVHAADGETIGQVSDVATDEDGPPASITISVGARLGFGARIVELPKHAFSIQDGRVVLEMSADVLGAIPDSIAVPEEK